MYAAARLGLDGRQGGPPPIGDDRTASDFFGWAHPCWQIHGSECLKAALAAFATDTERAGEPSGPLQRLLDPIDDRGRRHSA